MAKERRFLERARDAYETAGEKIIDARDRSREKIQENPFTSVLIAAAIGAVVGVATSEIIRAVRRRNRR